MGTGSPILQRQPGAQGLSVWPRVTQFSRTGIHGSVLSLAVSTLAQMPASHSTERQGSVAGSGPTPASCWCRPSEAAGDGSMGSVSMTHTGDLELSASARSSPDDRRHLQRKELGFSPCLPGSQLPHCFQNKARCLLGSEGSPERYQRQSDHSRSPSYRQRRAGASLSRGALHSSCAQSLKDPPGGASITTACPLPPPQAAS